MCCTNRSTQIAYTYTWAKEGAEPITYGPSPTALTEARDQQATEGGIITRGRVRVPVET